MDVGSTRAVAVLLLAFGVTACAEDKIVEVIVTDTLTVTVTDTLTINRALFNPPPAAALGFLGYFEASEGLTTCGNCHIGTQLEWETTAHSGAWETLENSGGAQDFCRGCHSVTENGNPVSDPAGWNTVPVEVYHDVQCESCHGPGLEHVTDPSAGQPIPSLAIPLTLDAGCAECHSGAHHPFADEWAQSPHATVVASAAGNPSCQGCHRGQGVLDAWGVNTTYLEQDAAEHLPITCGVCHDPHSRDNTAQLRFPIETPSVEEHLCAKCHNRRGTPSATSSHGLAPHAPEAAILAGEAGWFPPGAIVQSGMVVTSHGTAGNAKLCATCHVNNFEILDAETGAFLFNSTGHLFRGLPCVDADGIPVPGTCEVSTTARTYQGCADLGCHGNEAVPNGLLLTTLSEIKNRADDLRDVLLQVDPGFETPGGFIDPTDPSFTVAEGAFFNYNLANFKQAEHGDPATTETLLGGAVHNPFLMRALLVASLDAMRAEYGVVPTPLVGQQVNWKAELELLMQEVNQIKR